MRLTTPERPVPHPSHDQSGQRGTTVAMGPGWFRWRGRYRTVVLLVVPVAVLAAVLLAANAWWAASPSGRAFVAAHPCHLGHADVPADFPAWLRGLHWFNLLLVVLLARSGLQILADHPRLYVDQHSTPDREWLRFRGPVPRDRPWTSLDDSVHLGGVVGLPGGRHTVGQARSWHFLVAPTWIALGVAYVVLLFATGEWRRLVPTSAALAPSAVSCASTYARVTLPPGEGAPGYNALQQLTYFATVFLAAPATVLTGLAQSPALVNRFPRYERLFGNRQIARSAHFLLLCYFVVFTAVHVVAVALTGLRGNLNNMVFGAPGHGWAGPVLTLVILAAVVGLNIAANATTWRWPRGLQAAFEHTTMRLVRGTLGRLRPSVSYPARTVSPYFWANGALPSSERYRWLAQNGFRDYRLRVCGAVARPVELSLDQLRALGTASHVSQHNCIQGWSGVAEWTGVPVAALLDHVRPLPQARWAVFYSYGPGVAGGPYYDAHPLDQLRAPHCLLAWAMNGEPLPLTHGAPLRLRNENELGYKQVKWIERIEFVADYRTVGAGHGGYNEDHKFYGVSASI